MIPFPGYRSLGAGALLVCSLVAAPGSARADVSPQNQAMAQALFDQGRDLLKDGKTADACDRFGQSQKLDPKLGTLMNLAQCDEDIGKLASAWALFRSAATQAAREQQPERETYAKEQVQSLAGRLSTVNVQITRAAPGMVIEIDEQPFDGALAGSDLPIDQGEHQVAVTAPGKTAWHGAVTINAEQQKAVVTVPVLADEPTRQAASDRPRTTVEHHNYGYAIVAFSVGGVGFLVGSVSGIASIAVTQHLRQYCQYRHCDSRAQAPADTANALANVSNVSLPIGLVGIGVGALIVVLDKPTTTRVHTALRLGAGSVGLEGTF